MEKKAMEIHDIFQLGELFERVQIEHIFPDSKTFVDSVPKTPLIQIKEKYDQEKNDANFRLEEFVNRWFDQPPATHGRFQTREDASLDEHITGLWDVLTQQHRKSNNSLIALPHPYVVPGGRFREMFYWDSYFTMLGLAESNRYDLIENMIDNFAYLIDQFGYIPNGNRTYFLGRSQPPFFALMVELLAKKQGTVVWKKYLPYLEKEYAFWMKGTADILSDYNPYLHVVRLPDGVVLNRYHDTNNTPRPEAYKKDMDWAKAVDDHESFFNHERAACESGWDFSSRWFVGGDTIIYNRCADHCAIDLNCLLYYLERTLANRTDAPSKKEKYMAAAFNRKENFNRYFWNDAKGFFFDYNFEKREQSDEWTIAAAFPLYFKLASQPQADSVADAIKKNFLKPGGVVTTLKATGQQWDAPNGWAPLQWIAIIGLHQYGHTKLATEVAKRWMRTNEIVFKRTGKMMEKYNVEKKGTDAEAGTYPTQDGFGWTNGVYLACKRLLAEAFEQTD